MKETIIEICKVLLILLGIFLIMDYLIDDKTKQIKDKLDKIENNSNSIDSIKVIVDSIKQEKTQIINNIDRRTVIINQLKDDLKKPTPKDTDVNNAINFLKERYK